MNTCETCDEVLSVEFEIGLKGEEPWGVFCPECARNFVALVVHRCIIAGAEILAAAILNVYIELEQQHAAKLN